MELLNTAFTPVAVTAFGLIFGSFANVVIWRFPRGESLSVPASHCPQCDSPISWYDNIPVLSWLFLRGRCRGCSTSIALRYPLVELLSGGLWLLAWVSAGPTMRLTFMILMFYLLLILAFIDLDTMRLPNTLVGLLALIGVAGVAVSQVSGITALPLIQAPNATSVLLWAASGVLAGAGPALLMSLAYSTLRGSQGLGMGDVKLLAALGLFLGPYSLLVLFMGSVFGVIAAVLAGAGAPAARQKMPFGPSLALAGVVVVVWGQPMVAWYLALL